MKIKKILFKILLYIICIFAVGYLGGVINSSFLYKPTVSELKSYNLFYGTEAKSIAAAKFNQGAFAGGLLGIFLAILIRMLMDVKQKI